MGRGVCEKHTYFRVYLSTALYELKMNHWSVQIRFSLLRVVRVLLRARTTALLLSVAREVPDINLATHVIKMSCRATSKLKNISRFL